MTFPGSGGDLGGRGSFAGSFLDSLMTAGGVSSPTVLSEGFDCVVEPALALPSMGTKVLTRSEREGKMVSVWHED